MELKVKKEGIKKFLNLISLSGENQINEALFTIKSDSISTLIKSPTNTIGLSATLKGKFEEVGEIGIDDVSLLKNSLNIQDAEEMILKVKDNKLTVTSGKTKASLLLRKSDYIKNKPKEEDFNKHVDGASGNEFKLTEEDIESILKAYNLIKSDVVTVIGDKKNVKFLFNRLDNEIEVSIDLKKEIQAFKTNISSFLLYILNSLQAEEVSISIKKDINVVLVSYEDEDLDIKYIIAPYGK